VTRLTDLDAVFVGKVNFQTTEFTEQDNIDGAQGILFNCPLCGRHSVLAWFSNPTNAPRVPDTFEPGPGRWTASGSGLMDITLIPSINLDTEKMKAFPDACKWHGWVKSGDAA
jgi:Family of unknown function (DUF6527)